jgi:uncharacterized protein (UPF0335 family)
MEVRTSETAKDNIIGFAKRLLNLQLQKKRIDVDIKALKEEFKEEGVAVSVVNKVVSTLKANAKKSDSELFELDTITEYLEADAEVMMAIEELNNTE